MTPPDDRSRFDSDTSAGWSEAGSFLGSVLAGTLLGHLGDRVFGTEPWLLVVMTLVGAYSGFMKLWATAKQAEVKYGRGR